MLRSAFLPSAAVLAQAGCSQYTCRSSVPVIELVIKNFASASFALDQLHASEHFERDHGQRKLVRPASDGITRNLLRRHERGRSIIVPACILPPILDLPPARNSEWDRTDRRSGGAFTFLMRLRSYDMAPWLAQQGITRSFSDIGSLTRLRTMPKCPLSFTTCSGVLPHPGPKIETPPLPRKPSRKLEARSRKLRAHRVVCNRRVRSLEHQQES